MQITRDHRDDILRLAQRHGVVSIRIFGSVARREASKVSDIDFLVQPGPLTSPWFPAGLIHDLEQLLGCKVHVVTVDALHWSIRDRIVAQAVPL